MRIPTLNLRVSREAALDFWYEFGTSIRPLAENLAYRSATTKHFAVRVLIEGEGETGMTVYRTKDDIKAVPHRRDP